MKKTIFFLVETLCLGSEKRFNPGGMGLLVHPASELERGTILRRVRGARSSVRWHRSSSPDASRDVIQLIERMHH